MKRVTVTEAPDSISSFLRGRRIVVAGVSRQGGQPANSIYRRLKKCGYEVFPANPKASEVEGVPCFPDVAAVPGPIDGVVVVTSPQASAEVVRQCVKAGVRQVWFHRSFGQGGVSDEAVRECEDHGVTAIVGGCPLMYCEPVDLGHRCMRWWLQRRGRIRAG